MLNLSYIVRKGGACRSALLSFCLQRKHYPYKNQWQFMCFFSVENFDYTEGCLYLYLLLFLINYMNNIVYPYLSIIFKGEIYFYSIQLFNTRIPLLFFFTLLVIKIFIIIFNSKNKLVVLLPSYC